MNRTSNLRRMLGTGLGCVVLGATVVAMAAPAGAADASPAGGRRHRVHLTAEQKQCLAEHGVTRPIRPLTPEKVQQLKDAATACDIKLPLRRHLLTAEQKQCLAQQGITRPIRPLTPEKVQQLKDAATACDIKLPLRHHRARLTADQKQCLSEHGVTRPIRPLTPEKVQQLKDAAAACGIQRPAARATASA